jgi:hypothetical protein
MWENNQTQAIYRCRFEKVDFAVAAFKHCPIATNADGFNEFKSDDQFRDPSNRKLIIEFTSQQNIVHGVVADVPNAIRRHVFDR